MDVLQQSFKFCTFVCISVMVFTAAHVSRNTHRPPRFCGYTTCFHVVCPEVTLIRARLTSDAEVTHQLREIEVISDMLNDGSGMPHPCSLLPPAKEKKQLTPAMHPPGSTLEPCCCLPDHTSHVLTNDE